MNSIKVCEYSRSRSFHDDLILQNQASGERSQDQWSSGLKSHRGTMPYIVCKNEMSIQEKGQQTQIWKFMPWSTVVTCV